MSDLQLNVNGDSSGAVNALDNAGSAAVEAAAEIEKAFTTVAAKTETSFSKMERETIASLKKMSSEGEAAWKKAEAAEAANVAQLAKVQTALLAVGAAALKFGIDSVEAFSEAERVQKQLERAAGDLADAFSQQADAIEQQLGIDGELIKQQQTLLLQWGAAPGEIEPAIRAIEDYAAATGKDGVSATKDFLNAVEVGDAKLAKYGVTFEQTGDKQADFKRLTEAMAAALGGAAATNRATLAGSLGAVEIAFGNVKESFGGLIAAVESRVGVLDRLASTLQRVSNAVASGGFMDAVKGLAGAGANAMSIHPTIGKYMPMIDSFLGIGGSSEAINFGANTSGDVPSLGDVLKLRRAGDGGGSGAAVISGVDGSKPFLESTTNQTNDAMAAESARIQAEQEKAAKELLDAEEQMYQQSLKLQKDAESDAEKMRIDSYKAQRDMQDKQLAEMLKAEDEAAKQSAENIKRREAEWRQAGDAIGAAFVNALGDQLSKLAAGEEFDAAVFVGDILASVISVAATVIGTAYGQPALGAAVGNLASMGVRAGAAAISKGNKKKYHSGGWIGDEAELPRYHSGGYLAPDEVPMIGQKGEYMLSRRNVQDMGGPAGVERAIKGGSGPTISLSVMAIDAKNVAEGFVGELGAGLKRALRTGQGDVPALLGVSPR